MAQSIAEYKQSLEADPETVNTGTWYARGTVHHDGLVFKAGQKLSELKNGEVAQLLDVNALTSVAPKEETTDVVVPPHNGAPNQTGVNDDGVAHGNNQAAAPGGPTAEELAANGQSQRLDENGNPITEA